MRDIKFRAWDGKQMSNTATLRHLVDLDFPYNQDNITWLQYTGLKDKNGVEIYDGDIVKWDEKHTGNIEDIQWSEEELAWVCHSTKDNGSWLCGVGETGKVIGNIHEHPQLLETT